MNDTTDSTELTKQTDAAANVAVSRVVSVRSGCVPDDRRECLVTVTFSNEVYLAKYNEVTGKWMIAFSNREPISSDNIREWAYVEDVFTPSLGERLDVNHQLNIGSGSGSDRIEDRRLLFAVPI